MPLQTNRSSRFAETQTILFGDTEAYGKWTPPSFINNDLPNDDLIFLVVDQSNQGRPDIIANEIYGDSFLDWVIIAFNKPRSTLNWPKAGDVIRVPKRRVVATEVS